MQNIHKSGEYEYSAKNYVEDRIIAQSRINFSDHNSDGSFTHILLIFQV